MTSHKFEAQNLDEFELKDNCQNIFKFNILSPYFPAPSILLLTVEPF